MAEHGQITHLLAAIGDGDGVAANELLPRVYEELRALARREMAREPAGHTLQPTALVHEAYLRLVGGEPANWNSLGHFFAAAAEAMRRILVERARKYQRRKHGGGRRRVPLDQVDAAMEDDSSDLLSLDRALRELQSRDPRMYDVAMLRHFAGLSNEEVGKALGISTRSVSREWSYARLWLAKMMTGGDEPGQAAEHAS
ncbi:MAG: ECF-type sigma factor [Planctomycetota bacterium]